MPSRWWGRLAAIGLAWGLVLTGISVLSATRADELPTNRPIKLPAGDHVSSDACRSCHPGNYASWHASFHRTMTQVATFATTAVAMDGLELSYDGVDYRVEQQGSVYAVRSRPQGNTVAAWGQPREIVLLTGSHTLQIYWLETG